MIATDALGKAENAEPLTAGAKQTADEAIVAVTEARPGSTSWNRRWARTPSTKG